MTRDELDNLRPGDKVICIDDLVGRSGTLWCRAGELFTYWGRDAPLDILPDGACCTYLHDWSGSGFPVTELEKLDYFAPVRQRRLL